MLCDLSLMALAFVSWALTKLKFVLRLAFGLEVH